MPGPNTASADLARRVPSLRAEQLLARTDLRVVDLRSPGEFAEDHLPHAHNVPLFDDLERAVVGTLYHKASPDEAFERGRAIVREKLVGLVARLAEIAGQPLDLGHALERFEELSGAGKDALERQVHAAPDPEALDAAAIADPLVLHCWRGGMRSRSVAALVRALGLSRAVVLEGGYRAWRAQIVQALAAVRYPPAYVLRGLTGVGKTLVLGEIEALRPGWTIDLEGLAGHRSSLLGMVGREPCSQKMFESRLFERLRRGLGPCVVFEGESRKVGDVILPPGLWSALGAGTNLELVADEARRSAVLREDYLAGPNARAELLRQLPQIEARMRRERDAPALCALLEAGREDELVRLLLAGYYDPLYRHSDRGRVHAARLDAADPARAARAVVAWIEARGPLHPVG